MPKSYAQLMRDTNEKGLTAEQVSLLLDFQKKVFKLGQSALRNKQMPKNASKAIFNECMKSNSSFTGIKNVSTNDNNDVNDKDTGLGFYYNQISNFFDAVSKPEILPYFLEAGTQGDDPLLGKNGEKLISILNLLNNVYGMELNIDRFEKALDPNKVNEVQQKKEEPAKNVDQPKNEPEKAAPSKDERIKAALEEKKKLRQAEKNSARNTFLNDLDEAIPDLSAKHYGIIGTTSDELQAVKNAVADYKAFMADPKSPRFTGKTEMDMLKAMKDTADEYMRLKRENGVGDTTAPDWLPKSNMGQKRYLANERISRMVAQRIVALRETERLDKLTVREKIEDEAFHITKEWFKNKGDKYYKEKLADEITWFKLSEKHGNKLAKDVEEEFEKEKDTLLNSEGFKILVKQTGHLSAEEKLKIINDPEGAANKCTFNENVLADLTEEIQKHEKNSLGCLLNECSRELFKNNRLGADDLRMLIALQTYANEMGADTIYDNNEFKNHYLNTIDTDLINSFMNDKSRTEIENLALKPASLVDEYKKALNSKLEKQSGNGDISNIPGNFSSYQNEIENMINGKPPKTQKDFEEIKNAIMINTACIIATKSIWPKPETRTKEEIYVDLGKEIYKGGTMSISKLSDRKHIPNGIRADEWNKMSLEERHFYTGKNAYKSYVNQLKEKRKQQKELSKEIYENREDFKNMFDKANDWESLVKLSKKALTNNARLLMNELYKSGQEIKNNNGPVVQGNNAPVVNKEPEKVLGS